MAAKKAAEARRSNPPVKPSYPAAWAPLLSAVGRFVDKFGVSFAVLLLLCFMVWSMGDAKTKNDFIRELLFAEVTGKRYVQGVFAFLTLDAAFGVILLRRWLSREKRELKRCTEEKSKLQEMLAGKALAHTADHVIGGNNPDN